MLSGIVQKQSNKFYTIIKRSAATSCLEYIIFHKPPYSTPGRNWITFSLFHYVFQEPVPYSVTPVNNLHLDLCVRELRYFAVIYDTGTKITWLTALNVGLNERILTHFNTICIENTFRFSKMMRKMWNWVYSMLFSEYWSECPVHTTARSISY